MVIDFHTHVFPEKIAPRALETLSGRSGGLRPVFDGTPDGLIRYLRRNRVDRAVVLNIATNPKQQAAVNDFAIAINEGRFTGGEQAAESAPAAMPEPDASTPATEPAHAAMPEPAAATEATPAPESAAATEPAPAPTAMPEHAAASENPLIAFGSVYPFAPDALAELDRLHRAGIKGVKFHPEYQDFFVDDERLFPLYRRIASLGFVTVFHAGADVGYPKPVHSTPERLAKALPQFGGAPVVASHFGGYIMWDDVERCLVGKDVYLDTSYTYARIPFFQAEQIVKNHGARRILFGSDLPWSGVDGEAVLVERLSLSPEERELVFSGNALRLLGMK
ncbi:MAG: amidohydrolase family protein [Clostridiales bacterium]|jgi:predicted TIM-barrel fold metal-dependent hydrolase|nr:amidohydrolase family protein [Clostridiales bacterium]